MTYSRPRRTTIGPECLTAVFGMGTGMATRVWSPGDSRCAGDSAVAEEGLRCLRVSRLVGPRGRPRVAGWPGINAAKRSAVSTGRLRRLPALHLRPIDQVVFLEPSPCGGRPRLAGGFTL